MRKILSLIILIASLTANAQKVLIKTNLPYTATATPNLGIEFSLSSKLSLNLEAGYNPFEWKENLFHKHILAIPELRYWTCYKFNKSFFGLHGIFAKYNIDDSKLFSYRSEGTASGVGISYGYHLYLAKHWGMEFVIGLGYLYLDYDKYESGKCGEMIGHFQRNYFGPTRLAISLVYIL